MPAFFADQPNAVIQSTFRGRLTMMGISGLTASLIGTDATPNAQLLSLGNWYEGGGTSKFQAPLRVCPKTPGPTLDCSDFARLSAAAAPLTQMELQDGTRCVVDQEADGPKAYPNGYPDVFFCDNAPSSWAAPPPAASATSAFVTTMLADERAARMAPPTACSSTAVRIHRVGMQGSNSPSGPSSFMGPAVRVQHL